MSDVNKIRYRTEKVPPEGGWGYFIILGLSLPFGCCWGYLNCFGLIFNDFIEKNDGGTSAFTLIMGLQSVALSLCALFSSSVTKISSMRTTALIGSVLFFIGSFLPVFATSIEHLVVTYGILLGAGIGFMIPTAFGTFNEYFIKKRTLMLSIAQCISAAVIMFYPIMVNSLMKSYGFRGTLAVLAAIHGNAILGMLLMHPVKWHYKTIQVPDDESEPFINPNVHNNGVKLTVTSTNGSYADNKEPLGMAMESQLEVIKEEHEDKIESDLKSIKSEQHLSEEQMLKDSESIQKRLSVVSAIGNGQIVLCGDIQSTKNGQWRKIVDFLDLSLLKDLIYLNIVVGLTCALFSDSYFFVMQPMYLFEIKVSKDDTALIMTLAYASDMGSRILLSVVSFFITIKARYIYIFGAIGSILFRFVFLNVFDFMGLSITSALMGFFKTFIHLPVPLVLAEHLPNERYASGYGLFLFLQGIFNFLFSPFIGWVRDTTQSYVICFHTLSAIMGLCAVPWLMEFAWFRFCPRKAVTSVNKLDDL